MLKILFYSHTGKVSGAEIMLLLILRRLDPERFSALAVCPPGELEKRIRELDVACRTVNELKARFTWRPDLLWRYLISFFRTIKDVRTDIAGCQPDLIHANSIRAGLIALFASVGSKTDVFWHLQDELPRHPLSTLIRAIVLFSSRTRLIAASGATAESFLGKSLKKKNVSIRVVRNAIDLEKFNTAPSDRKKIRGELGLGEDELVFGIIGQITPRKGQLELVRIFAEMLPQMPAVLLIAGAPMFNRDHDYLLQIAETIGAHGLADRVRLLGLRNDVPSLMQALDILVVNSKSEALVVVAIEAMACGKPVIATNVGGTAEMISNGENGLLVPYGDKELLLRAMLALGSDPDLQSKFGEAGKSVVRNDLNAEKFMRDIEDYFEGSAAQALAKRELLLSGN